MSLSAEERKTVVEFRIEKALRAYKHASHLDGLGRKRLSGPFCLSPLYRSVEA